MARINWSLAGGANGNQSYQLQCKTNPVSGTWTPVEAALTGTGATTSVTNNIGSVPQVTFGWTVVMHITSITPASPAGWVSSFPGRPSFSQTSGQLTTFHVA
jgi:hypothetical protein